MENFNSIIDKLNEDYRATFESGTGNAYSKLSTICEELGAYLREFVQNETDIEIKTVIKKLRDGNQLSEADMEMIRLWVVDDAAQYMRLENNLEEWQDEFKRLMEEITKYKDVKADVKSACELRGLFRDGSRVLADIFYYLEQKDRVSKFEQASKNLGPQERSILIGLLEQKVKSPDF